MSELRSNRFTKYLPLLLDALRSVDPTLMRPAEARAWIRARLDVPAEDLTRLIKAKSKQTIFENDVHWARSYLAKAGLISASKRGLWGLTPEGRNTTLTPEETWKLYVRLRDANRSGAPQDEEDVPAPDTDDESADELSYWFVGSVWEVADQTPRFLSEGIWQNGYTEDQFANLVRSMKTRRPNSNQSEFRAKAWVAI
jgi:5-methylcytosine-specific restriction enzyme B